MYRMTPDEATDESHFAGLVAEGNTFRLIVRSDNFEWQREGIKRGSLSSVAMQAGAAMRRDKRALPEEFFVTDNLRPADQLALAMVIDAAIRHGYRLARV